MKKVIILFILVSLAFLSLSYLVWQKNPFAWKALSTLESQIKGQWITPTLTPTPIPTPTLTPTPTPIPRPKVLDGGRLFNLVNEYRTSLGLSTLLWYHPLCEYAKERSLEIEQDFSHEEFAKDATSGGLLTVCPGCEGFAENLAYGFQTEEAALQGWINSPGHKKILEGDWNVACAWFKANKYVSMVFGKKKE